MFVSARDLWCAHCRCRQRTGFARLFIRAAHLPWTGGRGDGWRTWLRAHAAAPAVSARVRLFALHRVAATALYGASRRRAAVRPGLAVTIAGAFGCGRRARAPALLGRSRCQRDGRRALLGPLGRGATRALPGSSTRVPACGAPRPWSRAFSGFLAAHPAFRGRVRFFLRRTGRGRTGWAWGIGRGWRA